MKDSDILLSCPLKISKYIHEEKPKVPSGGRRSWEMDDELFGRTAARLELLDSQASVLPPFKRRNLVNLWNYSTVKGNDTNVDLFLTEDDENESEDEVAEGGTWRVVEGIEEDDESSDEAREVADRVVLWKRRVPLLGHMRKLGLCSLPSRGELSSSTTLVVQDSPSIGAKLGKPI